MNMIATRTLTNATHRLRLLGKLREHLSLLVLLACSGAMLFGTTLMKGVISERDYGVFAIIVTVMSVAQVYGVLGSDQVMIRMARINERIVLSKKVGLLMALGGVIFSFIVYLAASYYISHQMALGIAFLAFTIACLKITSACYRLMHGFVMAQLLQGWWKLALILWLAAAAYTPGFGGTNFIWGVVLWNCIAIAFSAAACRKMLVFRNVKDNDLRAYFVGYFLSMSVVTIIGYGERFVIARRVSVEVVGQYFYVATIILMPFVLLGNYISFNKLAEYKKYYSGHLCRREFLVTLVLGSMAICAYIIVVQAALAFVHLKPFNIGVPVIIALAVMALARLSYGVLSAAMGANGDKTSIAKVNVISLVSLVVSYGVVVCSPKSLILIVWLLTSVWLIRVISFYRYIPEHIDAI
jgi:hypothetical protein